jgi:hypothetical protein
MFESKKSQNAGSNQENAATSDKSPIEARLEGDDRTVGAGPSDQAGGGKDQIKKSPAERGKITPISGGAAHRSESRATTPKGHGSKFERKMEVSIQALLSERNIEEDARVVGIGKGTLYRWMKNPEFAAAYLEARRAVVAQSNARLQRAASVAVSLLLNIMVDLNQPGATRVRAAEIVLDRAARSIEYDDVLVRLDQLEERHLEPNVRARRR